MWPIQFARQFLRKMWPIQFAFHLRISCRIFLCSLTLSNTSSFLTWSVQLIFSILLHHQISKLSRCFWSTAWSVQVSARYKALFQVLSSVTILITVPTTSLNKWDKHRALMATSSLNDIRNYNTEPNTAYLLLPTSFSCWESNAMSISSLTSNLFAFISWSSNCIPLSYVTAVRLPNFQLDWSTSSVARSEQNETHSHKLEQNSAKAPPQNNFTVCFNPLKPELNPSAICWHY